MSAEKDPVTPPATSGGITLDQVSKLVETTLAKALGPVGEALKALTDGQAKMAESQGKSIKAEDVAKLVTEQVTGHLKSQADADAKTKSRTDLRQKVIDGRLKGVPTSLINLPDTDDEAALNAAADKLRKDIEAIPGVKLADVGGASKDGGTTPATGGGAAPLTPANSGLSEGVAKFANSIKMPSK